MNWLDAFRACPLVAILRGVTPDEIVEIVEALVSEGFTLIEVPLNSPEPIESIRRAAAAFAGKAILGAGTVLRAEDVGAVHEAGGRLIIAPNFSPAVAKSAIDLGMIYGPGVATATEAFAALDAGAAFLKFFPAEIMPPSAIKALRAVLPAQTLVVPVGGVTPGTMAPYLAAGANGFGFGSALYTKGLPPAEIKSRAATLRAGLRAATAG